MVHPWNKRTSRFAILPAGLAFVLLASGALGNAAAKSNPHSVLLHWAASASAVTGYNVYRSEKSGGPYKKLNRMPILEVEYRDSEVKAGKTYFYAVTSLNSRNDESPKSSEIRATVPKP